MSNRPSQEGTLLSNSGESSSASSNADAHGIDGLITWSSSSPGSGIADARGVDGGFIGWRCSHPGSTRSLEDQANCDGTKDQTGASAYSNLGGSRAEPPSFIPSIIRSSNQLVPRLVSFQNSMNTANLRPADSIGINSVEHGSSSPSLELLLTSSRNHNQVDSIGGGSTSSTRAWGFSCKRRAFEGTSQPSQPSSSSSGSDLPGETNPDWLGRRDPSIPSRGISLLPSSSWHSLNSSFLEQQNLRAETAGRDIDSEPFPSTSAPGNGENARRLFNGHVELESMPQREPAPFNRLSGRTSRRPFALRQPYRPRSSSEGILRSTLRLGSMSSSPAIANVSNDTEISGDMLAFQRDGASQSRSGNSSSFRSRTAGMRDDLHVRNSERSTSEVPVFTSADQARNLAMQLGQSSNFPPSLSSRGPSQTRTPIQQQPLEVAPWSFFPNTSSVAGRLSTNLPAMSLGPSYAVFDATSSNGGSSQTIPTRSRRSLIMDAQDDDDNAYMPDYLLNLPSDEARTRLLSEIRQVLDALHRGEQMAIEEFFVFEPFVHHGLAELHDRHRDMRLDVDNMSYEELLALGERIGDVSTGLSEETILKCMKQKKILESNIAELMQEPCCICQEEYVDGDDLGILDCGHEFHSECIKQWLAQKNLCPICKATGLIT
ncbi:hypothetical protein MLD38_026984 [Melastoma candidum]|uniref:Uncharacterized protein n=1 Tax=Melastoma candidum TaxID=119954 RepID=A0ACB9P541_9MYRT|nr:hypothetical protein MLD38_026984 [Melastoma candidum]